MRFSRDLLLLLSLFIVLVVATAFLGVHRANEEEARQTLLKYSSHSSNPGGTLALYNWLDAIGYHVQRIEESAFHIQDNTQLLFVFEPTETFDNTESQYVVNWVAQGNTLILAEGNQFAESGLLRALKVNLKSSSGQVLEAALQQPLVDGMPQPDARVDTYVALSPNRSDFVQYLSADGRPVLISFALGKGKVWLTSAPNLFTNENLKVPSNAALVLALIGSAGRGSHVAFDEYHLGLKGDGDNNSMLSLIYNTPWGWAFIYGAGVLFVYLILNGRRFGRVVPLPQQIVRRSASEYVVSMAQLFRRAGKRGMVLKHYRHSLKRRLGRPFHLNPDLPDDQFVNLIARLRGDIDLKALRSTLSALNRSEVTERELVNLAQQSVSLGERNSKLGA